MLVARAFVRARLRWRLRGAALERYQDRRARSIVAYTRRHSPFYRAHWQDHDTREWQTLPMVDKRAMMAHFDTFNTRGIRRAEAMEVGLRAERSGDFRPTIAGLTVGLSSGTSGHRGLFLASWWEQAGWAGTILARILHGVAPRRLRVAFFLRSNSNLYEQVGGRLIELRYFNLMTPLDEVVEALNQQQPEIVVGPPSLLGMVAERQTRGALRIRPSRLVSVAEVLEPQDCERIEAAFAAPVHQIYQCTEGLLAVSCVMRALHIQEDLVALQMEPISDGDGERVTPIVTDLWRRTQPIIRYRLNDVLQLDPRPCACGSGFRVIRAIEGRCDDVCYFDASDGGARPVFPDTIRRMILLASSEIEDYQGVQERHGHLRIQLLLAPGARMDHVATAVRESIATTLAKHDCRAEEVAIEEGLVTLAPGAKRRRIMRTAD
jgi:phenylacetate-CoA ligase